MAVDKPCAAVSGMVCPIRPVPVERGIRFALLTVNFSTTEHLKLMLLTLCEQARLPELLGRVVIVDNDSRDGGVSFISKLAEAVPGFLGVFRRRWLHHGPAMRAGVRALNKIDTFDASPSNVLLFCDPDVIFRRHETLMYLADLFEGGAALVGEPRNLGRSGPDIQASFFAVKRDVYARRDVAALVHDGSPAHRLQASVADLDLPIVSFPSNKEGFILHRGRSGVASSRRFYPGHPYATVATSAPHFMGVANGPAIWREAVERHSLLLDSRNENELVEYLAARLSAQ